MDRPFLKLLSMTLILSCLYGTGECEGRYDGKIAELYPDLNDRQAQKLVAGYLRSLDGYSFLLEPERTLRDRRAWHHNGCNHTVFLINQWGRKDQRYETALLLGGTHDDRAALALKRFLKTESETDVRLAIYSALAELGFFTDYHARLLLAEHERRWPFSPNFVEGGSGRPETTATLLSIIHHPEAVWAQSQLRERRLADGAVGEMTGPLAEFRDVALGRRPMPKRKVHRGEPEGS